MRKGIARVCAIIMGLSLCLGLADYPVEASGMELISEPVTCVGTETTTSDEAESMGTLTYSGENWYDEAYEVLELVNQERSSAGLNELTMDQELLDAAMLRAAELSVLFSHTRPNGESCLEMNAKINGENIAAGYQTAEAVMYGTDGSDGWMNSPMHQANILSSFYNSIGIGCFYNNGLIYWVQCFSWTASTSAECPENQSVTVDIEVAPDYLGTDQFYYYGKPSFVSGTSTQLQIWYINSKWNYAKCVIDPSCFEWSSDNEKVIVDDTGMVTCSGAGTFTITATLKSAPETQIMYSGKAIGKAAAISLDKQSVILELGGMESLQLNPIVEPEDVTNSSVIWYSSNEAVASVDKNGIVTAVAPGNAIITVKTQDGSNLSATCEVEVRARVTDITLSATSCTLAVGDTYTIQATVQPDTAYKQEVEWTTSDAKIATVSDEGVVIAVSSGTTIVTCMSASDNSIYACCEVVVVDAEENPSNEPSTEDPSEEEASTEDPSIEEASTEDPSEEEPSTEDPSIEEASTEDPSEEEPSTEDPSEEEPSTEDPSEEEPSTEDPSEEEPSTEEPGTEKPDTDIKVTGITLSKYNVTTIKGRAFTLKATVTPENATNTGVIWKSSNETIATVGSDGRVRAVGVGTVTITCTAADGSMVEESCTVTIKNPVVKVRRVKLSKTSVGMTTGTNLQINATLFPGNTTNRTVNWTSSNTSVATVSASGRITAIAPGRAVITCAATDGGGKMATCNVWVYTNTESYVSRIYTKALGRDAEEGGLNYWTSEINNGYRNPVAVAEEFFFSEEFGNKNLDNTEYVKVLYRTFMGREYDQAGLDYWVARLNAGESRQSVLKCFAGCPEFQNIVASFGL